MSRVGKRWFNLQKIEANQKKATFLKKLDSGVVSMYGHRNMFRWLLKNGYVTRSREATEKGKRFCKKWTSN